MQKDFKVGMMVGVVALIAAVVWLSTRPDFGTQARFEKSVRTLPTAAEFPDEDDRTEAPVRVSAERENPSPTISTAERPPAVPPLSGALSPLRGPEEETREKIKTNRLHIVRSGETLSDIAQTYLGSARLWPKLLEANRETLVDPHKIRPGMKLVIPRE